MNSSARCDVRWRSRSSFNTCARTETSSAETGSSATMNLGLRRDGPRHAHPLALAPGQLVRIALQEDGRLQADPRQQLAGPDARVAAIEAHVVTEGHLQACADRLARVERGGGVLEDDLHLASEPLPRRAAQRRKWPAVVQDLARGRRQQPEHHPPQRRLARAGLADQRHRLALGDGDRDVVDGPQRPARPEQARPHHEDPREVAPLDQRRHGLLTAWVWSTVLSRQPAESGPLPQPLPRCAGEGSQSSSCPLSPVPCPLRGQASAAIGSSARQHASAPLSRAISGGSFERQCRPRSGSAGGSGSRPETCADSARPPGIENNSPLNASTLSVPRSRPWVYGWRGRANSAWTSFVSTTRPAYIT